MPQAERAAVERGEVMVATAVVMESALLAEVAERAGQKAVAKVMAGAVEMWVVAAEKLGWGEAGGGSAVMADPPKQY